MGITVIAARLDVFFYFNFPSFLVEIVLARKKKQEQEVVAIFLRSLFPHEVNLFIKCTRCYYYYIIMIVVIFQLSLSLPKILTNNLK